MNKKSNQVKNRKKQQEKNVITNDKLNESIEEYTKKEIQYIDKYQLMSKNRMSDEEIYEIIIKHNFNDEKIEKEIKEFTKIITHKGDDYGWNIVDKGNSKPLIFSIFLCFIII